MDSSHLRAIIIRIQDCLSDDDRKRLHFFFGNDVPRRIRDDPSLSGTLDLMENLFEQEKINEQDFSFLVHAFDEINCLDAVKILKDHMRRMRAHGRNQSLQSLTSILLQDNGEDEEEDKMRTKSHELTNLKRSALYKTTDNKVNVTSAATSKTRRAPESGNTIESSLKILIILLAVSLLIIIVLAATIGFSLIKINRLNSLLRTKDSVTRLKETTERNGSVQESPISNNSWRCSTDKEYQPCPCTQLIKLKWIQHGRTIAGGKGRGSGFNQLANPYGIALIAEDADSDNDENVTIYIADRFNDRIMQWRSNGTEGRMVAGTGVRGNQNNQLNLPTDVIVSKRQSNNLIICDQGNRRIVHRSLTDTSDSKVLISNISCWSLAMDKDENLYITDSVRNEVTKWTAEGERKIVISGQEPHRTNLAEPSYLFVDDYGSVYLSDWGNHQVLQWKRHSKEGFVVAGGHGQGYDLTQLNYPQGLFVDHWGTVVIVDGGNSRIMRACAKCRRGEIILGGHGRGSQTNQFNDPKGLAFDKSNNMYVVDRDNHRVLKFCVDAQ